MFSLLVFPYLYTFYRYYTFSLALSLLSPLIYSLRLLFFFIYSAYMYYRVCWHTVLTDLFPCITLSHFCALQNIFNCSPIGPLIRCDCLLCILGYLLIQTLSPYSLFNIYLFSPIGLYGLLLAYCYPPRYPCLFYLYLL